jgi:hypothetical protein
MKPISNIQAVRDASKTASGHLRYYQVMMEQALIREKALDELSANLTLVPKDVGHPFGPLKFSCATNRGDYHE